ncbi:hypothetical protein PMZ80_008225 [Knufia obscura]|uniref:PWWP domain-containing protein n=2 Tax=Knufia TaxID=430999 RepID=A0AAN8EJU6_9EURO|nr:hypothetical protein PMZ80_008225 [Knufia obscura]KAK5957048.1 hypothetical protein OHC33_001417 [Knufia fluminis]
MSDSAPAGETVVPVKVTQPEDKAPPSLAEPASGPAAEMSGALAQGDAPSDEAGSKPAEPSAGVNGAPEPAETEPAKSVEEKPAAAPESEKVEDASTEPAQAADADTEMKDAEPTTEPASSAPAAAPESNGTSAAKPKRKSSTGVPEHRSKTLKKKQSKAKITNLDATPGDLYLARLRSYPPWPAIICSEDMLPEVLLNTRPVTAQQKDGTYKEPYVEGGKKVGDRTFPIMFLHTNEFAWIPNTDLTPFDAEQAKGVPEKGKTKSLVEAFKVAAEGHDLEHFKQMLFQHEEAMAEDERLRAEYQAEKAAKAEKKKRKSEVKVDEDVDMEDAEEAPKKSSKKRKKEAESGDEEPEKPAKTPKTTKIKLNTGKTPTTDKKTEKKTEKKTPKAKSEKKKKAQESEEEVEPEKEEEVLDPVEARKAREKEVLFLRHKLQKGFLTREQEPAEAEMPQMASYIKKLEAYGGNIEVDIIRKTKINKVLKGIVKLNTIPKDEEYHFRERSVKLLAEWNVLLGAEPAEAEKDKPAKEEKGTPTTTNGVHKEAEEKADEKIDDKVEEPEANTVPAEEAVEKVSAEVTADAGEKVAALDEIEKQEEPAEEVKTESAAAPVAEDKAPESAAAAAEATELVKEAE